MSQKSESSSQAESPADEATRDAENPSPQSSSRAEADPGRATREDDDGGFPGPDELIGTFMREPALWPVLIVALGSAGAFGAALLILTAVDRNPFAAAALLLILGMSIDVGFRARRRAGYRNLARLIGLIWLASIAFAALAIWTGLAFA